MSTEEAIKKLLDLDAECQEQSTDMARDRFRAAENRMEEGYLDEAMELALGGIRNLARAIDYRAHRAGVMAVTLEED